MKVWTVTSNHSNEDLDCEVFATEQQALEGYLIAMMMPQKRRDHFLRLYWDDITAFEDQINDYLDEWLPGDMYRLYEHEIEPSNQVTSQ